MKSLVAVVLSAATIFPLAFVQNPEMSRGTGETWTISFELSEAADVEVAIVNLKDSTIVKRLAAGVLGANPPAPFTANSLSQALAWDGKDDLGRTVPETDSLAVRVRAGMSAGYAGTAGENYYNYASLRARFFGLTLKNGSIFIYGGPGTMEFATIRQYDGEGNYTRTVYPPPASLNPANVQGWGINLPGNGQYGLKTVYIADPNMGSTFVMGSGKGVSGQLLSIGNADELLVVNGGYGDVLRFKTDGTIADNGNTFPLITSPATPSGYYLFGDTYLCPSHDNNFAYFSSFFEASRIDAGCHLEEVTSTGFWQDGQVFRINMSTGVVSPWLKLDSVPVLPAQREPNIGNEFYSAIHGVAIDDQNHVFVCDRLHTCVSVYDTAANLIRRIPVRYPDQVYVNNATGNLYVLTRVLTGYHTGQMTLKKYSGWAETDTLIYSKLITTSILGAKACKVYLAVTQASQPVVWMGYGPIGVRAYKDMGDSLVLIKDFYPENQKFNTGFDRIAVDKRNETVYINDSWQGLFKVEDWSNPVVVPCTTSSNQRLYGRDFAISEDNQFYLGEGTGYNGPIKRFTLDQYLAPIPFPNTGDNIMTPVISSRFGAGYGEHGIAVGPDKRVADMYMYDWCKYFVGALGDSGQRTTGETTGVVDTLVKPIDCGGMGGVRFDRDGNLYIGATIRTSSHVIPEGYAGDWGYQSGVGSIIRYPKGVRGSVDEATHSAPGSDLIYNTGLAPFSGYGACMCRTPRFDLDPYGRLFIPNAITQKVTVVDNNDNRIVQFGQYANMDSRGPGSLVPTPGIPLAWPVAATTSDNYIYVSDMVNCRVVRVKMDFALDNMPGFNGHTGLAGTTEKRRDNALRLIASPNPFNPVTRISVAGAKAGNRVTVYDLNGRVVARLPLNQGVASWNAAGKASGMYVVEFRDGKRTCRTRISFMK